MSIIEIKILKPKIKMKLLYYFQWARVYGGRSNNNRNHSKLSDYFFFNVRQIQIKKKIKPVSFVVE